MTWRNLGGAYGALIEPGRALRELEERDFSSMPDSAFSDGTLWRLARSATALAPDSVWAWSSRAHYASVCALMSVDASEEEPWWDDCMICVDALERLPDRRAHEVALANTATHATGLGERYERWAPRHELARRLRELGSVRVDFDARGWPRGWGLVGESHFRVSRVE